VERDADVMACSLCPEVKFPVPVEDTFDAVKWVSYSQSNRPVLTREYRSQQTTRALVPIHKRVLCWVGCKSYVSGLVFGDLHKIVAHPVPVQ